MDTAQERYIFYLKDYDRFYHNAGLWRKNEWRFRILSEKSIEQMCTPYQITDEECQPGVSWGLGFMLFSNRKDQRSLWHQNFWIGQERTGTHMFVHPDLKYQCNICSPV